MAIHTVIEINHDLAHRFKDNPKFGEFLYYALSQSYTREIRNEILDEYGIRIVDQHHSGDCKI